MKTDKLLIVGLFAIALAMPVATYAHDGDGHDGASQGKQCQHMTPLPDDKRQLLHETMRKVFEKDKAEIEQMHKLHKQMHDVLAAETFNQHAFMSLSAQIEKVHEKIRRDRVQAFASIAGQFTPEEREMVARMHHHHHHHHGHDGSGQHDGHWHDHSMNDGSTLPNAQDAYPPYPSR